MGALDLGHIEETGCVANESATREGALGNGLEATLVQCTCAVGNALATFKVL
jgi:hypothetical protein